MLSPEGSVQPCKPWLKYQGTGDKGTLLPPWDLTSKEPGHLVGAGASAKHFPRLITARAILDITSSHILGWWRAQELPHEFPGAGSAAARSRGLAGGGA